MLKHSLIVRDAMRGPWDNSWSYAPGDYTYIAKDENSDVYKIGKSNNLRARMVSIRNSCYFFQLDYQLVAFAPGNIESLVQEAIIHAGGVPLGKWGKRGKRPQEMFRLEEEDINVVIESFLFHRVDAGVFPTGYQFSKMGELNGYVGRYDITGWEENPVKRKIPKSDGNK